jgi:hypothetical protein
MYTTNRDVLRTPIPVEEPSSPLNRRYTMIRTIEEETMTPFLYPEIEDLWQFLSNSLP